MIVRDVLLALACVAAGTVAGAACVPFQCPDDGDAVEIDIVEGEYAELDEPVLEGARVTITEDSVVIRYAREGATTIEVRYEVIDSSYE